MRAPRDATKIGYWSSVRESELPNAEDAVDESWDADERAAVLAHLKAGGVSNRYRGSSRCRICGERNGSSEQTDGVHVWPSGLAHYVEEHGVRLPAAFVEHVLGVG